MKKERYHRIVSTPTAGEASAGLTSVTMISDGHAGGGVPDNNETPYASATSPDSSSSKRVAVRRHDSRGSYSSVLAAELVEDESAEPDLMMLSSSDDVPSRLTGEKSPLNLSFDSDERSASNNAPRLTTLKFGLDDDDDDDFDVHVRRYALDFGNKNRTSTTIGGADPPTRILPFLWWHIQTARQQARQRRAQLLLQQSERRWKQSLYICLVTTLCDATDGGIALAAVAMLLWILALWKLEVIRISLLLGGIVVWTIRFGARPAREYWIQQRLRQYRPRQRSMQPQQQQSPPRSYNDNLIHTNNNFAFAQPRPPSLPTAATTTTTMEMSTVRHYASSPSSMSGHKATTTTPTKTTTTKQEPLTLNRTEPTIAMI